MTKIYLVTVTDQETIDYIDRADENGDEIFIGPWVHQGPADDIEEYVNVDSP